MEIALDDTLVQARIVPKIQCSKRCDGDTIINEQRYSIFRAPKFVFVTLETASAGAMNLQVQQPIQMKSNLVGKSFSYRLTHFIIITKDERTFIIKPNPDNTYLALNHVTKLYEPLFGCNIHDFIAAAARAIVLCYETEDAIDINSKLATSSLDLSSWTTRADPDSDVLEYALHEQISHIVDPIKIGPYRINTSDITEILSTSHELNDEQLNAHLWVTSTLADRILLVDSIAFSKYVTRGFDKLSEVLDNQWFKHNIVLVPMHHSQHWTLFIIDTVKKTILFFDSLKSLNRSYEQYHAAIFRLLRIHNFYTNRKRIDLSQWRYITDFSAWQQQDATSCGVHCAMFARSYVTETRRPPITNQNVQTNRRLFSTHLITGT
jgi:Ulp1 protease family, C-terminal catalytic domain